MNDDAKTERLELRVSREMIGALDAWRREQADLPSRSEALRRLASAALDAARRKGGSKTS